MHPVEYVDQFESCHSFENEEFPVLLCHKVFLKQNWTKADECWNANGVALTSFCLPSAELFCRRTWYLTSTFRKVLEAALVAGR